MINDENFLFLKIALQQHAFDFHLYFMQLITYNISNGKYNFFIEKHAKAAKRLTTKEFLSI